MGGGPGESRRPFARTLPLQLGHLRFSVSSTRAAFGPVPNLKRAIEQVVVGLSAYHDDTWARWKPRGPLLAQAHRQRPSVSAD